MASVHMASVTASQRRFRSFAAFLLGYLLQYLVLWILPLVTERLG